jgi:hypothetical protein
MYTLTIKTTKLPQAAWVFKKKRTLYLKVTNYFGGISECCSKKAMATRIYKAHMHRKEVDKK